MDSDQGQGADNPDWPKYTIQGQSKQFDFKQSRFHFAMLKEAFIEGFLIVVNNDMNYIKIRGQVFFFLHCLSIYPLSEHDEYLLGS